MTSVIVGAINAILCLLALLIVRRKPNKTARYANRLATYMTLMWSATVMLCIGFEVSMVTIWRTTSMLNGYSGRLDYGDIAAYLVGWLLMVMNYVVVRPWMLRRMPE